MKTSFPHLYGSGLYSQDGRQGVGSVEEARAISGALHNGLCHKPMQRQLVVNMVRKQKGNKKCNVFGKYTCY